jgi:hypothetical protein
MTEELINKLFEYLQKTETFILEQAPDFIRQLLTYKRIGTIVSAISLFAIGTVLLIFVIYCIFNPWLDKYGDRSIGSQLCCFLPLFLVFICYGQVLYDILFLIKLYMAPKVYLLEYFRNLKGG